MQETGTIVVAADVGGTNTRLGLFRVVADGPEPLRRSAMESDPTRAFGELLDAFLVEAGRPRIAAGCCAVAGPVVDGRASMTNHPWVIDAEDLGTALGGARTLVVNDVQAAAAAVLHLPADRLHRLAAGHPNPLGANVAVLAPGTGLGCAALCFDGTRHHLVASEGGHADFAPQDEEQVALWRHLATQHGHVSYERIASGPGLVAVYEYLREAGRARERAIVRERLSRDHVDAAAVVSHAALAGDPLAAAALDLFVRVLGAKAGNLALEVMALGGVYLAGGIPPKILPTLDEGGFMTAFLAKGRHRDLLERVPVHVALDPAAPLLGAARLAAALAAP